MIQTNLAKISVDELLVGDIIFFINASKQASHVAVYAGKKSDIHFITHAISEPYSSVMTTRLKSDQYPYRVFRCKNFNLALQVTARMLSWVTHGLSFSHDKSDNLYSNFIDDIPYCDPKNGGQKQLERAQRDFNIIFYRYIAMASHPTHPFMVDEIQHEGVRCSEAITMAYNVETLLCSEAVFSLDSINAEWVSDKTAIPRETIENKFKPHNNYWSYFQRANDPNEYYPYGKIAENGMKDGFYPCSLSVWNFRQYPSIEDFIEKYPFSLPLDSKIVSSWAMMVYMQEKTELWQDMGQLDVPIIDYALKDLETQDKKTEWKKYVINLFEKRGQLLLNFQDGLRGGNHAEPFQSSPEKKKPDGREKRERSLSCDLSSILEQPRPVELESDGENSLLCIAQTVLFERGSKFVSPTKMPGVQSPKILKNSACKRKLF